MQLAGLPGTGKTRLAAGLRQHFGDRCLVLAKDLVREALYGGSGQVTYKREQDDFVVSLLHRAAQQRLSADPTAMIVLERTCTRAYQIADVTRLAAILGQPLAVIVCWCPDDVAKARLDADYGDGRHPAANRTFALYQQLRQTADPVPGPALRLRTDQPPGEVAARAVDYLETLDAGWEVPVDEPRTC